MKRAIQTFVNEAPFLKLLVPFILGLLAQHFLCFSISSIAIALLLLTLLYIIFQNLPAFYRYKNYIINGILFFGLMICLGLISFKLNVFYNQNNLNTLNPTSSKEYYIGDIKEVSENHKSLIEIKQAITNDSVHQVKAKCLISFDKENVNTHFDPYKNYSLVIKNNLKEITNNGNLGSFDFKTYYQRQSIYHKAFLSQNDFIIIDSSEKNWFNKSLLHTKFFILKVIQQYIPEYKDYGMMQALLIAHKSNLDKETLEDYVDSGTIHVIAISGLHLGFIYLLIAGILLKKLDKNFKQKLLKFFICLFVLWFYALLAGAGASILRAAVMFSFLSLSVLTKIEMSKYNLLSVSAFVLLCYNPYYIFDIGFIFSYTAILGLFVFYFFLQQIYISKSTIINYFLNLMYASLAAQIFILPFLLLNFHSFPTYFLINNMVAGPLSTVLLCLAFALIICSFMPLIAVYIGKAISLILWCLNSFLNASNNWKYSKIIFNLFDYTHAIIYFIIVFCVLIFLFFYSHQEFKKRYIFAILFLLITLSVYNIIKTIDYKKQDKLMLYSNYNQNILELVKGNEAVLFLNKDKQLDFYAKKDLKLAHHYLGIHKVDTIFYQNHFSFNYLSNKILYLIHANIDTRDIKNDYDYIILSKDACKQFDILNQKINCNNYVLDNSCPHYLYDKIKSVALNKKIYFLKQDGAFIL